MNPVLVVMSRHIIARGLLLLAACAAPGCSSQRDPNIVLIISDTLRADKLGCYGFEQPTSETLDELATKGVLFRRTIAPSSWTRPSIGALLTSQHPRTLGLYKESAEILDDEFTTLAEVLGENGYTNAGVTANPNINSSFNFDQGFDFYLDSHVVYNFMTPKTGMNYDRTRIRSAREVYQSALDITQEQCAPPCYLQLNIMEPHEYQRGALSLTRVDYQDMFDRVPDAPYLRAVRQASDDTVVFIDTLVSRPGWENTLFVIISDHGLGLRDNGTVPGASSHGYVLYESQLIVPLILFKPGWKPETRVVERPVRLLDVGPTILDFVGIAWPGDLEGLSLLPLTRGVELNTLPDYFVAETQFRWADKIAVYGAGWTYFENRGSRSGLNPRELQVAGGPEQGRLSDQIDVHPQVAGRMDRFLRDWEREHPKRTPTVSTEGLSDEEREQLRSLGYIN